MPQHLVEALVTMSDLQSLSSRTTDAEVIFKGAFARSFIDVAVELFKWVRSRNSAVRRLELIDNAFASKLRPSRANSKVSFAMSSSVLDLDDIITDAGNDEEEGDEEDEGEGEDGTVEN